MDFDPLSPAFIRNYISQARQLEPFVPQDLTNYIVEAYVGLREQDSQDARKVIELMLLVVCSR